MSGAESSRTGTPAAGAPSVAATVPDRLLAADEIVEAGLSAAERLGTATPVAGCAVVVQSSSQANLRWANNTVTTNGVATSVEYFVVVIVPAGTGFAAATVAGSAGDAVSREAVADVVRAAAQAAESSGRRGPARDGMPLFGADGTAGGDANFDTAADATSFDVFAPILPGLADAFAQARTGDRVLYGFARHEMSTIHLGTSTGVRRRWVQPTGTFEMNAKSTDMTRSSWSGLSTVDFTDVDVAAIDAVLRERLGWAQRRIDLPPGHYDTVLPPSSVADVMIYLAWSAGARAAHEGRSVFAAPGGGTRVGQRLTDRALSLYGDPAEHSLECAPFVASGHSSEDISVFDNGAPIGRTEFVQEGVIRDLLHTRASAAEYGSGFTSAPDNLILAGGDETRTTADLVAGVERGLLITSLWYIREVDPMSLLLTGLTRDGVYLIENGEVTGAVNNFRFNMSPLDVLRRGVDVGRTERCLSREWSDYFTRTAMPPIRVSDFHMSSVSQAQ